MRFVSSFCDNTQYYFEVVCVYICLGLVLLGHRIFMFSILPETIKLHTVFHKDCTNLHFYQECTRILFSPQLLQLLLLTVSVQSLSHVWLFVTPWTTAHQASLSITNSQNLLKLMSIESVMPSNHLILCCHLLFLPSILPRIRVFQMSQFFISGAQNIGVSASTSVLPMNIQDWFPLGWTGWSSFF